MSTLQYILYVHACTDPAESLSTPQYMSANVIAKTELYDIINGEIWSREHY